MLRLPLLMIPSHWFRRFLLGLLLLEILGGMAWVTAQMLTSLPHRHAVELAGMLMFISGLYAGAPLFARFLAPYETACPEKSARVAQLSRDIPHLPPVFVYDHPDQNAMAVGILPRWSHIYVTSALVDQLDDNALRATLAHEQTHTQEHHILWNMIYACVFALSVKLVAWRPLFLTGFLVFLTLRRWMEYRADAGAARITSPTAVLSMLEAFERMQPTRRFHRFVAWLTAYPTTPMRIHAIQTGKSPLF
jgi:heat shock protein HtpX